MKTYYILIDKLDDRWVDNSIKYRLIQALIESLKSFRRITNLKIVVALRSDIIESITQENNDFQPEKYEDYIIRLKWTREQLIQLFESRVRLLFRRKYSAGNDILPKHVFAGKIGQIDLYDYLLERTLLRPRDLIMFVNSCFEIAAGKTEVSAKAIREAEAIFSRSRLKALEAEWKTTPRRCQNCSAISRHIEQTGWNLVRL